MTHPTNFVAATGVRQALVARGDIRGDIEFQNDINCMLARLDEGTPAMEALTLEVSAVRPPERSFRVIRGGVGGGRQVAEPPRFKPAPPAFSAARTA
jgi:hypothetical protein